MSNLLPPKSIKKAKIEAKRRLIVVSALAVCFLLCLQIIFSVLSLFWVNLYKKDYSWQLVNSKKLLQKKNLQSMENEIARLNHLIALFESNNKLKTSVSESIADILNDLSAGVMIDSFNFQLIQSGKLKGRSKVVLSGLADRRENFLSFLEKLKSDSLFESVESPLSNILTERDIEFSLSVVVKGP